MNAPSRPDDALASMESVTPGRGSKFRVHLPVVVSMPGPTVVATAAPAPAAAQRILIVDDNRDAADALASLLELEGHEAHVAHDGESALVAADELRPDAIMLDIGLPRLNGYEVASRIRTEPWGRSVLLLALTGWGHPDDRTRSDQAGFDHHLVKPVEIATLVELLTRHAARPAA